METVTPESVGLSSTRLQRITDWLEEQVTSERVAGASVLLSRRGKIAYFSAIGQSEVSSGKPFVEDTIVRIYSMTKSITTVAAMMLFEEGFFQLDDPVAIHLPEFRDTPVWIGGDSSIDSTEPMKTPMTVRQLMTHTSGLTYGFMNSNVVDREYRRKNIHIPSDVGSLEEWIKHLATIPLMCQPGSEWNYSVSTDVLGRLVEVWSGMSLDHFFKQRILQPLGMNDTGFHVEEKNHHRFSALYAPLSGGDMSNVGKSQSVFEKKLSGYKLEEGVEASAYLSPTNVYSGGGGLTSTIADYGRFCQMLLNRGQLGGERLLSRKTVEFMRQNQLPDNRDMAAMGQPVWS